jgi:valyl-tRNA synthetase
VLETLLRLAHPIMPFITEEIWQRVAPLAGVQGETIMRQPYPVPDQSLIDEVATRELEWLKTFILGIRRIRAEYNIKPGKPLPVLVRGGSEEECGWLKANTVSVLSLARVESIDTVTGDAAPESATALAGGMTVLVPFADLIDPQAERERLRKERDKLEQEKQGCDAKLANSDFVQRAPAEVIAKQRARSADLAASIQRLEEQLGRL